MVSRVLEIAAVLVIAVALALIMRVAEHRALVVETAQSQIALDAPLSDKGAPETAVFGVDSEVG